MRHSCFIILVLLLLLMPSAQAGIEEIDPPLILEPEDNAVIYGPTLTVRWQTLADNQWCQIQLARDPDFKEILVDADEVHDTVWIYDELPQDGNRYYWRICAWQQTTEPAEGEEAWEGEDAYHPADTNKEHKISKEQAEKYSKDWQTDKNPMRWAVRGLYIHEKSGAYYYDASQEPPLCWVPVGE